MADRKFTAREKQKAADREVGYRRNVYSRRVADGKMKQAQADEQIAVMEQIAADYREIADNEDAAGRLL